MRHQTDTRSLAIRIFLTCWIVYGLHVTTEVVREHYPTVALGDHLTFRLDEYAGLHPDLFETEDEGWRQGNNPGIAFFAAVPYAAASPAIDALVEEVRERRAASGRQEPPSYEARPLSKRFFEEAWERGLDVKLGLAAWVTQAFFMAPLCAASVVMVFLLLDGLTGNRREALWLALIYAFGTPVFYRAGFLNHNMALGIIAFGAFLFMWDPWDRWRPSNRTRLLVGGLGGGLAVLFDYSGLIFMGFLFVYALLLRQGEEGQGSGRGSPVRSLLRPGPLARDAGWFAVGAIGPLLLLWFYQWQSFGHPFLPAQHYMPPVKWIEEGYQGYGFPQLELFAMLGFDHRFGLFAFCPLLLAAFAAPWMDDGGDGMLPRREALLVLALLLGLWIFFSGSNYTRLQYNTGVRYMAPVVPFLFVAAAAVVRRFRPGLRYAVAAFSVGLTWCLTMYREVEQPLGVLDPVVRTLVGGLQLPALRTLERMEEGAYGGFADYGTSPIPLLLLAAAVIYGIWRYGGTRGEESPSGS